MFLTLSSGFFNILITVVLNSLRVPTCGSSWILVLLIALSLNSGLLLNVYTCVHVKFLLHFGYCVYNKRY